MSLPLLGPHQAHNAAVALAGLDVLAEVEPDLAVSRDDVVRGFAALRWPARVEVVGEKPWLVIDGAHNAASAAALADTLRDLLPAQHGERLSSARRATRTSRGSSRRCFPCSTW